MATAAAVPRHGPTKPRAHRAQQIAATAWSLTYSACPSLPAFLLPLDKGLTPSICGVPLPCLEILYNARKIQRYSYSLPHSLPLHLACGWQLGAAKWAEFQCTSMPGHWMGEPTKSPRMCRMWPTLTCDRIWYRSSIKCCILKRFSLIPHQSKVNLEWDTAFLSALCIINIYLVMALECFLQG